MIISFFDNAVLPLWGPERKSIFEFVSASKDAGVAVDQAERAIMNFGINWKKSPMIVATITDQK